MVQVGNKMDEISNLRIIIKDEIFFLVNLKYAIYHVCGYGKLFFKGKGAKFKKDWKLISSIEKFFIEKTDNPHLNTHDNTTYNTSAKYYRKLASIFNKIITFFIKNYNFMQTYDLLSEYTIKITEKTAHNEITEHIPLYRRTQTTFINSQANIYSKLKYLKKPRIVNPVITEIDTNIFL